MAARPYCDLVLCYQLPSPLPRFTRYLQVKTWIKIHVAYATPDGYVRMPIGRVIADEVGNVGILAVEGFKVGLRISADKTQFEVDPLTILALKVVVRWCCMNFVCF